MTEILIRAEELTRDIIVNEERMLFNANLNKGLDNSEYVMMSLAKVIGKEKAHEIVYEDAILAETEKKDYFEILSNDKRILSVYSVEEVYSMLDPKSYIGESKNIALEVSKKAKEKVKEMEVMK